MQMFIIVSRRAAGQPLETYAFGQWFAADDTNRLCIRHPADLIDAKIRDFRRCNPQRVDIHAIPTH